MSVERRLPSSSTWAAVSGRWADLVPHRFRSYNTRGVALLAIRLRAWSEPAQIL